MPPVDMWKSETAPRIVADLPAVRREDPTFSLDAERLQIEARRCGGEHCGVGYKRRLALHRSSTRTTARPRWRTAC